MLREAVSLAFVLSSALVNFHFQYCTCPPVVLPLNIRQFNVTRLTADKAELKWSGYDEPFTNYYYEAEVSRDGVHFISIGVLPKNNSGTDPYRIPYRAVNGETGTFYFRVKQVYPGGYSRYSNIKQVNLENSDFPGFTIYPNPSTGIVGIKFDNTSTGRYNIHIYNAQGQTMMKKDIAVAESSYVQVAALKSGVYWIKLTDVKSQLTRVNQLLIK
ncbi:MAG: T9SS type A sorting domain-containing protein [Bacteroidota bacterium]